MRNATLELSGFFLPLLLYFFGALSSETCPLYIGVVNVVPLSLGGASAK